MQSRTQSSFPRLDRPLPRRQLIARVKAGSIPHIWELYETFKQEDCTLDLLKSILSHLEPELIPDIDPRDRLAEARPHASAAAASLLLLPKLAVGFRNAYSHIEPAIDLILSSMEGVLQWINFCLDCGVPRIGEAPGQKAAYIILSEVLFMLASMNQRLRQAFLSSKAFLQTFFRIWVAKDDSQGRHTVYWDFKPSVLGEDPIVGIAWTLLGTDPSTTALVIGKELSALDLTLPFAAAATQRMNQVRNIVDDPMFPNGLLTYAQRIVHFILSLLRAGADDGNLEVLLQCFKQVHIIGCLTAMQDRLASAFVLRQTTQGDQGPDRPILGLKEPLAQLIGHLFFKERRTISSIITFLKKGGLRLLVRMILEIDVHDRDGATALAASFTKLASFTVWPAVLKQPLDPGGQTADPSLNRLARIPHYQPAWAALWASVYVRAPLCKSFTEGDRPMICDNFLCPRDARTTRQGSPKQCSGCSSVLYCSQSCQRRDWNQRHRDECARARQLYLERQGAGMEVYDHNSRAFHVKLVEALCEERYMALFQSRVGRWGLTIHDFHPIFECNAGNVNEEIVLFRTHPTPDLWMHKPDAPLVEKYLWPRMNSLGEIYNQRMKNSEMRLAEAVFSHGPGTDIYVYVLLKQVGEKFQATYSIPRIATIKKRLPRT